MIFKGFMGQNKSPLKLKQNEGPVPRQISDNTRQMAPKRIEYILEWYLLKKSVKRPFCFTVSILQPAGVLHKFVQYNLLGPEAGTSFYRKVFLIII